MHGKIADSGRRAAPRLSGLEPLGFRVRVDESRGRLAEFVSDVNAQGKRLLGYGASTKGNVILQYCGLSSAQIPCIAEVNSDKFGCFTPGTLIPIVSETEAKTLEPDYFLVLPWHFRDAIVERERDFLATGGGLVMPLPLLEVVRSVSGA